MYDVVTYGGGIQSTTIAALIVNGELPRPKHLVMADTGRERTAVWDYLNSVTKPRLQAIGLDVVVLPQSLKKQDITKTDGSYILMPVYTETGKLPTFCSSEWKKLPVRRWLKRRGYCRHSPVRMWFGMSLDEVHRMRVSDVQWITNWYPLIQNAGTKMTRAECIEYLEYHGWPMPPRSACWMCPHRDDKTWKEIKNNEPQDFAKAVELEKEIRSGPWGEIWLHKQRVPLNMVQFSDEQHEPDECADSCWT